jgi:hypothetical protein
VTTHIYHPDVQTHGLRYDCPRCQEHARYPQWMDEDLRRRIISSPLTALDHEARERLLARSWEDWPR